MMVGEPPLAMLVAASHLSLGGPRMLPTLDASSRFAFDLNVHREGYDCCGLLEGPTVDSLSTESWVQLCLLVTLLCAPGVLPDCTSRVIGWHATQSWLDSYFQETRRLRVTAVVVIGVVVAVAAAVRPARAAPIWSPADPTSCVLLVPPGPLHQSAVSLAQLLMAEAIAEP